MPGRRTLERLMLGAAAGAAGTLALNATTYLDMAVRGRPPSSTPEQMVERLTAARGLEVPGRGERRQHRLTGLGALSGMATGVAVGVGYAVLDVLHLRPPGPAGPLVAGGGAMALANTMMARYDVTHPTEWSAADWLSDLVPHAVYGWVLASTYAAATS